MRDLRMFLQQLEEHGELHRISGANPKHEIGAICELSFENQGPALLFDRVAGHPPDYKLAVNLCSTRRRSLLLLGADPDLPEADFISTWQKRWEAYKPIPPVWVDRGPIFENVKTGSDVDLLQFPVPTWHELDGGPFIGTAHAVIQKDPETGFTNVGTYRAQLHDRNTTGILPGTGKDGWKIMRKYWKEGKNCPVAVSFGPEPLIFHTASGATGCPSNIPEYEYVGFLAGEAVPVVAGPVTGLPISASSEIAIEGEIPPPEEESRTEGPFGEWTGYYMATAIAEPVIRVKALYYRNNPILTGAPPFAPIKGSYHFGLSMRTATGMLARMQKLGLPVKRIASLAVLGATVISVDQQSEDDADRIMRFLDKTNLPSRLLILVDDDVNAEDPSEVLWAVGTRFDPTTGVRVSVTQSDWFFNPLRTMEDRINERDILHKRLILNGCRTFDRIKDFPPVNVFSKERRKEVWEKWDMAGWLPKG